MEIHKAKKILGKLGSSYSDEELKKIIELLKVYAYICFDLIDSNSKLPSIR